ncbi:hypothetical protein VNO78_27543 [Psophocarpus tetragonolobus]|uniref:FBD domain-containing protein n=1 Tax=Psophocarpus tetragonolobus TaxID=3891 RepID=A0AAN9S0P0_PSOTE
MEDNIDMFALLPDSLVLAIISYLPFKEAVRTCLLSKYWKHLWVNLPCIELKEHFESLEPFGSRNARRRVFLKFVAFWLDNRKDGPVDKFSLIMSNPNDNLVEDMIDRCVAFVTQHGVKELELDFSDPSWEEEVIPFRREALVELPTMAYKHQSIQSLKLSSCSFLANGLSNWRELKEVTLSWMEVNTDTLATLLSSCTMIESLVLKKCWNWGHFEIGNETSSLNRLLVEKCSFQNSFFKINAPNLCFFKYWGKLLLFEFKNLLAMEDAHLDFYLGYSNAGIGSRVLYDLVNDLYNARVLSVCPYILQVIRTEERARLARDMNTRHLTVKMNMLTSEVRGVLFFLRSCPMLECLTIQSGSKITLPDYQAMWIDSDEDQDDLPMRMQDNDEEQDDQAMLTDSVSLDNMDNYESSHDEEDEYYEDGSYLINTVDYMMKNVEYLIYYECLESSLKVVELKDFTCSKSNLVSQNGLALLCYLIRRGKGLTNVKINVLKGEIDGEKNVAFYRMIEEYLMTTPRASTDLQISICY